jgi:hypothetical protein
VTSGVFWVMVLAGSLLACSPRATKNRVESEEQTTLRKLDGYLQCHLDHSQIVFRAEDRYRLDFADGAPGPDRVVVLKATPDPAKCLEAIAAARSLPPSMPELENAGAAYATELARIYHLTSTYDRNKAAQLHAELLTAFDAFDHAQAALFDQIYAINRRVHMAQLALREQTDDPVRVLIERTQLAAENVARFAAVPWNELDKLDTVALANSIAQLELLIESLYELEKEEPLVAEKVDYFPSFRDDARALVTAARQLARRAHDNLPYTDAEKLMIREGNAARVVGSPAALADIYNRLADPWSHVIRVPESG